MRARVAAAVVLAALAAACGGDDATSVDPNALYSEDLPSPTPNVLRGIWSLSEDQGAGKLDVRLQFSDGTLVVAGRCTPNDKTKSPVTNSVTTGLTTDDLDAAKGTVEFSDVDTDPSHACEVKFPGTKYDFTITGKTLAFKQLTQQFTKVGD